jgi:hypothetical protein
VLEKNGEGWRRSVGLICEKLRSITKSQGGEEYPTKIKKKEGYLVWSHLA